MRYPMTPELTAAALQLQAGDYRGAGEAYLRIAATQPAHAAMATHQAGVAAFYLRDYRLAIELYERAGTHGLDRAMVQRDVAEAREELRQMVGTVVLSNDGRLYRYTAEGRWVEDGSETA